MYETSFLRIDQNWQLELLGECQQSCTVRSTSQTASENQQKSAGEHN